MIDRENRMLVKEYLTYQLEVRQLSRKTIKLHETWLRHLLEWAGEVPFRKIHNHKPAFPKYVLTARIDGKDKPLSNEYTTKVIREGKRFLEWLSVHKTGYKNITPRYLDLLQPPRLEYEPKEREYFSEDEIHAISQAPVKYMRERRIRAALVFMWLSGIRPGEFVSLPLNAVDLQKLEIKVFPSLGVRVKNKKGRMAYIPDYPELLAVVQEWDTYIRAQLPMNGLWFPPLLPQTGELDLHATVRTIGENRSRMLQRNSREWLEKVGLKYHSPHKCRHGCAVNGCMKARTMKEYKALSQNLGHSSLVTTDGVYGGFYDQDVKETISRMGSNNKPAELGEVSEEELKTALEIIQLMRTKTG